MIITQGIITGRGNLKMFKNIECPSSLKGAPLKI